MSLNTPLHHRECSSAKYVCESHCLSLAYIELDLLPQLLLKLIIVGELRTRLLRHLGDRQVVVGAGVECQEHTTELRWERNGRALDRKLSHSLSLSGASISPGKI